MSSHQVSAGRNDYRGSTHYPNDFERPRKTRAQDGYVKTYSPMPTRTRKKWPPAPMVEDEETSLSREHSPSLPELVGEGEARMKGTVDQMPILFEIGKENEPDIKESKHKKEKRGSHRRSSSEDSFGPDTPTDSSASESNDSKHRRSQRHYDRSAGSSIKDVLDGKRRPEARRETVSTRFDERPKSIFQPPPLPPPPPASFVRSASSRDMRSTQGSQSLYSGTSEQLKAPPKGREYPDFAQRQRTMSGSNNVPDHRPAFMRHMSAMGYSGESQTPSFQRDHPVLYASPVTTIPRNALPDFRQPRNRDHAAIVSDSSESEISPNEFHRKKAPQRNFSKSDHRPSVTYNNPPRPPPKDPSRQYSRPSSPERRDGRIPILSETQRQQYQDRSSPTTKRSPATSSPSSPYPSPPASPGIVSRPGSRDGSSRFVYPTITKKSTTQAQRDSRPSSPVGGNPHPEHHAMSNLRYSSRPTSPNPQPSRESSDQKDALKSEPRRDRRDTLKPDRTRSRDPSPIIIPRSSRSPIPGLRVDVQQKSTVPAPMTWAVPNQEMKQRPSSGDGPNNAFIPSPTAPMSAPNWVPSELRQQQVPLIRSTGSLKQAKPGKSRNQLVICPRPGFTTNHSDWWTIPQIPELDLCPECKQSLQDNGFTASFVRGQPRPPGTQTRCDMNVSWVRIACLLVLSSRETPDVLKEMMNVLATEEPCPSGQPSIRKKWYRVYDEDADKHVVDFNICPACVRSVRVLFPNLKGTFNSHTSRLQEPRICDLTVSVPRFARYVDLMDIISTEAKIYREAPDTKHFVKMARDWAGVRPCPRDNQFIEMPWHYSPHIPDFTICGECFVDFVRPAQRAGSKIADQINRKISLPPDPSMRLSCQLYSARMRDIFEECCRNQDMASLREHSMARVMKERELQHRAEIVRSLPEEWKEQEMQRLIDEWRRWE